jgi:transcription factor SFP1
MTRRAPDRVTAGVFIIFSPFLSFCSIMDYSISRFSSSNASTDSDMTALPSTSLPRTKLETSFCRNFKCCGQGLENLHDLLQHYEERHVKFEDDDNMPAMVTDDDNSPSSSSASSSLPPSPKTLNAAAKTEAKNDTFEESSAFDTTIMRSSPIKGGKKRSFGQFSNGSNSTSSVHQSLRRALIDGGVGRGSSKASSIYSANSPFSTPGSSLPGTPLMDNDNDTGFFGNGNNVPAFSALSLRGSDDHDLPSCAPPNLFFPSSNTASSSTAGAIAPAAKRERITSVNSAVSSAALDNSMTSPNALGDRPYKCQSAGCDKAYKQMNGLKYHRLHGQCNQNTLPAQQQLSSVVNEKNSSSTSVNGESPAMALNVSASSSSSSSSSSPPSSASPLTVSAAAVASAINTASGVEALKAIMKNSASTAATAASAGTSANACAASAAAAAPEIETITIGGTPSPTNSNPGSPRSSSDSLTGDTTNKVDRVYICQVGSCGKRYKNLNGLRYHYLHSGSHGLLGLQLLSSNGGGPSARADVTTGRPAISTNDLSTAALAAAAQAAAAQQQANQRSAAMQQQEQQEQKQESDAAAAK